MAIVLVKPDLSTVSALRHRQKRLGLRSEDLVLQVRRDGRGGCPPRPRGPPGPFCSAGARRFELPARISAMAQLLDLKAALNLDEQERAKLMEALAAGLYDRDLGNDWENEIQRRIEDIDSGRVESVPGSEVFDRLEQRFGGR